MNLWDALGVSPQTGLLAAAGGLATAILMAVAAILRRPRVKPRVDLGLQPHNGCRHPDR